MAKLKIGTVYIHPQQPNSYYLLKKCKDGFCTFECTDAFNIKTMALKPLYKALAFQEAPKPVQVLYGFVSIRSSLK